MSTLQTRSAPPMSPGNRRKTIVGAVQDKPCTMRYLYQLIYGENIMASRKKLLRTDATWLKRRGLVDLWEVNDIEGTTLVVKGEN